MKSIILLLTAAVTSGFYFTMKTPPETTNSRTNMLEAEHVVTWHDLAMVQYKDVYIDSIDAWYWVPEFDECLNDLEGETIYVTGYLQKMTSKDDPLYLACRQKHMHMGCCGITGPEDLIDLGKAFDPQDYEDGDSLVFKGTFHLNSTDVYSLNYILSEAEVVEL